VWSEGYVYVSEEAKERGFPVVERAEAAEEVRVREEVAPALADEPGAEKRRRQRREAEEDLLEQVIVVRQARRRRRRRRRGEPAAHRTLAHFSTGLTDPSELGRAEEVIASANS
jgi:hypothetical protein